MPDNYVLEDELERGYESIGRRSMLFSLNRNITKENHTSNCIERAHPGKESVGIQVEDTVVLSSQILRLVIIIIVALIINL